MKPSSVLLAQILTYGGTLPLIACAALVTTSYHDPSIIRIACTYSAIIVSFLCGIHWAIYLFFSEKCPRNFLISSNGIALLAWGSLLSLGHHSLSFLLQAVCFLYLLTLDLKLRDAGVLPEWFYTLRRNATGIVVLCLSVFVGYV